MIIKKETLKSVLETRGEGSVLFLGNPSLFTHQEINRFLKKFHLSMTQELEAGVVAVVEHHRLTPREEHLSESAYEKKIPLYRLTEFEKLLSEELDDNALLMGIKLSNDQARILRMLGNEHLSDTLFVKLLTLYVFDEEEEDNSNDRDVIMYTLRRYITDIKPSEEYLLYSYLTLSRLAREANNPALLAALAGFPNFEFLARGKKKQTLREIIAANPAIDSALIDRLLSLRDAKVTATLCANPATPLERLHRLIENAASRTLLSMAGNRAIDQRLFEILLEQEETIVYALLRVQPIDMARLKQIEAKGFPAKIYAVLGGNPSLSEAVEFQLLDASNDMLLANLAANAEVSVDVLKEIYARGNEAYYPYLASNPSLFQDILERLYATEGECQEVLVSLACNPATPEKILIELFERESLEINRGLATNPSLPMALLERLQLDIRLQNELIENPLFTKAHKQRLHYDKSAVQF